MDVSAIDEIAIKQLRFEQSRREMQKLCRPEEENSDRPSTEIICPDTCWSLCECDPGWDANSGLSQDEEVIHEFL